MNDNEAMTLIIDHMMRGIKNKLYRSFLLSVRAGINGKENIEEKDHPRYRSVLFFGFNIFPFKMSTYREMAKEIIKNKK